MRERCRESAQPAEASETSFEDAAHDVAGADHIRVSEPVADLSTVALRLDHPGGSHDREVLRDIRLAGPELGREAPHLERPGGESVQDLEPSGTGQDLEDFGLEDRDLVHGRSGRRMHMCA